MLSVITTLRDASRRFEFSLTSARRLNSAASEKIAYVALEFMTRYLRRDYIYDNTGELTDSPFFFIPRLWKGGNRKRAPLWISDRKLLWPCHEGALAMRAVHPSSWNSNDAVNRISGGKLDYAALNDLFRATINKIIHI